MINPEKLDEVRDKIQELNNIFISELGVRLDLEGIRYSKNQATGKLTITSTEEGQGEGREAMQRAKFERGLYKFKHLGLTMNHHGKVFTFNGEQFRPVSLNTRAPKYPFIVESLKDGKEYRCPKSALRNILEEGA